MWFHNMDQTEDGKAVTEKIKLKTGDAQLLLLIQSDFEGRNSEFYDQRLAQWMSKRSYVFGRSFALFDGALDSVSVECERSALHGDFKLFLHLCHTRYHGALD